MRFSSIDAAVRNHAAERPDDLALADAPNRPTFFGGEVQQLTWSELDNAVGNVATALRAFGAGAGTAIAIQLPNVAELVVTLLACGRCGATAVPFPIQHRRHELDFGLGACGATIVVTAPRPDRPDQMETVRDVAANVAHSVTVSAFDPNAASELSLATTPNDFSTVDRSEDDPLTICWTSGTTGTPKGIPRNTSMWLASGYFQVEELELGVADRMLCPFPIVNMAGIGGMMVPWLLSGAVLHLHQPLDLAVFLRQMSNEQITYTVAPPALLNMLLLNEDALSAVDLSAVRKIASGSAPLDPWMVQGWAEHGIEIVNVFGSNEGAALLSTATTVPDAASRARYFPKPDEDRVNVRIVDLDIGTDVLDTNVPGELRFRGPTVFSGYLGSDGAEFDDKGYYRTGDIFEWVDTDSDPWLLRFVDRAKDIVIRGGMNISAAELEALISQHASVAECAVVGFPDAELGERVGVFAVATQGAELTLGDIVAHLRSLEIASYKLPERLETIDQLPRNPVGKVTKEVLRARWR